MHQTALSLFRLMAAVGRTIVIASTLGTFAILIVFLLGGFIIDKGKWFLSFPCSYIVTQQHDTLMDESILFPKFWFSSFVHIDNVEPWMIWGFYISPMMYGQNAIAINEFLDDRWSQVNLSSINDLVVFFPS